MVELHADEVVPDDVVRVEPGDQLVADGAVIESRGLTHRRVAAHRRGRRDPQAPGDRMLSGSFAIAGAGHYEVDAVREKSYAEKLAGEAREFRHPPSPLQIEVNSILWATTMVMIPLARSCC